MVLVHGGTDTRTEKTMREIRTTSPELQPGRWITVAGVITQPVKLLEVWPATGGQTILVVEAMVPGRSSSIDITIPNDWPIGIE